MQLCDGQPLFAPPGVSCIEYALHIQNYFEWHRQMLRKVQSHQVVHIPWGEPVKVGRHRHDSLDVWQRGQLQCEELENIPTGSRPRNVLQKARSESPTPSPSQAASEHRLRPRRQVQTQVQQESDEDFVDMTKNITIPKKSFYGNKSKAKVGKGSGLEVPSITPSLEDDDDMTQEYLPMTFDGVDNDIEMDHQRKARTSPKHQSNSRIVATKSSPTLGTKRKTKSVKSSNSTIDLEDPDIDMEHSIVQQTQSRRVQQKGHIIAVTLKKTSDRKNTYDFQDIPLRLTDQPTLETDAGMGSGSDAGSNNDTSYVIEDDSDTDVSGYTTSRAVRVVSERTPTPGVRRHTTRTALVQGQAVEDDILCQSLTTPSHDEGPGLFESFENDSPPLKHPSSKDNSFRGSNVSRGRQSSVLKLQKGDIYRLSSSENDAHVPNWKDFKLEASQTSSPHTLVNRQSGEAGKGGESQTDIRLSQERLLAHSPELTEDEDPVEEISSKDVNDRQQEEDENNSEADVSPKKQRAAPRGRGTTRGRGRGQGLREIGQEARGRAGRGRTGASSKVAEEDSGEDTVDIMESDEEEQQVRTKVL